MSAIAWEQIEKAIQNWVVAGSGLAAKNVIWAYQKLPQPQKPYIELSVEFEKNPAHDWITQRPNPLIFADKTVASVDPSAGHDWLVITGHELVTADGPVRLTGADLPAPLLIDTDYWVVAVDANKIRLASTYVASGGNDVAHTNPITTIDLTTSGSGTIKVVKTPSTVRAGREIERTANGMREVTIRLEVFGAEGSGGKPIAPYRILSDVIASLPLHVYDLDLAGVGMSDIGTTDIQGGIKTTPGRDGGLLEPRTIADIVIFVSSEVVGYIGRADRVHVTATATLEDGSTVEVANEWSPSPP